MCNPCNRRILFFNAIGTNATNYKHKYFVDLEKSYTFAAFK